MDLLLLFKAAIMGLVEGITEFLPISSTGHLILSGQLLDFWTVEKRDMFAVAVQIGAIAEFATRALLENKLVCTIISSFLSKRYD